MSFILLEALRKISMIKFGKLHPYLVLVEYLRNSLNWSREAPTQISQLTNYILKIVLFSLFANFNIFSLKCI
jgi:hypothetical protein